MRGRDRIDVVLQAQPRSEGALPDGRGTRNATTAKERTCDIRLD